MRSRMTNNRLEEYIRSHCCPSWDVRYEAPWPKYNPHLTERYITTSEVLLRETPISKWIREQIEERKKDMFKININEGAHFLKDDFGGCIPVRIMSVDHCDETVFHCRMLNLSPPDKRLLNDIYGVSSNRTINPIALGEKTIERVIFHDPATIVYWKDGTKTVVKTQNGEAYDPEKGFAMAIAKKALGNEGNYYNTFTKWLKESEEAEG